ncbi:concanavalin A-like lectin/glucanase domain-containing protein [Stachybotrys elegans]|uniref:chitinase n=1 Tax=Stachybotrys elegans TaxID=80388 RepID=A0A8K0SKL6_9HYPO|nr:concanavalin A-like lectin/glucanase domain-containing protein [Stachybotrys elegans]
MLARFFRPAAAAALLLLPGLAQAQVAQFVDCNPMNKTNCPPVPAFGTDHDFIFNRSADPDLWETLAGRVQYDAETGGRFQITRQGESTTIMSKFYFFWGRTEIWLKTAPGTGIISSVMLLSDTLDEVDWEVLGSNSTHASTNYFGKGVEDFTHGKYHPMTGMHDDYHNYTIVWTEERMDWYIDGANIRTLLPADAEDGKAYPQTPMRISLGIWAGGDPSLPEGTREWAGGTTNYDEGPFYMYVKSIHVSDYTKAKEYAFKDQSGSADSVEVIQGEPESIEIINRPPPEPEKSLGDRWNELSPGARIGIYAGGGAAGALLFFAAMFYCIRQRRRGARDAKLAEQKAEAERLEMNGLKSKGIDPDSFTSHAQEYTGAQPPKPSGLMGLSSSYSAIPNGPDSPISPMNEKAYGAAAVGAAAGMAVTTAAVRSGPQSPRTPSTPHANNPFASYEDAHPPRSAHSNHSGNPFSSFDDHPAPPGMAHGGYASPNRTPSPGMMHGQSTRSPPPGPGSPAGYARMGSPGPGRMGSPGPGRMGSPGPGRMGSPGPGRMGSPGPGRMGSPGPGRMGSPGPGPMGSPGPNRMQSPGPGGSPRAFSNSPGPGSPRAYSNSPGPRQPRGDDYWNQEGGYR